MPFVDLHSKADYAAIFYTTNTPFMNVTSFDPEKPSVVVLHPAFLDLSWVDLQFSDSRLDSNYNIIAFDSRSSGKSTCRLSGRHDNWVDAADLAFCFQVCFSRSLAFFINSAHLTETPPPRKSYFGPRSFLCLLCPSICSSVSVACDSLWGFPTHALPRFPEMCLSLTLVNVPAPVE